MAHPQYRCIYYIYHTWSVWGLLHEVPVTMGSPGPQTSSYLEEVGLVFKRWRVVLVYERGTKINEIWSMLLLPGFFGRSPYFNLYTPIDLYLGLMGPQIVSFPCSCANTVHVSYQQPNEPEWTLFWRINCPRDGRFPCEKTGQKGSRNIFHKELVDGCPSLTPLRILSRLVSRACCLARFGSGLRCAVL